MARHLRLKMTTNHSQRELRGRICRHLPVGLCHCSEQHLSRALGPNSAWSSACGAGLHLWSDLRSISESCCFSGRRTGGSNSMEDSHGVHRVANYSRIYCRPGMLWSFSDAHGGSPCCTLSVLGGSISGTAIHYNASVCDSQRDCFKDRAGKHQLSKEPVVFNSSVWTNSKYSYEA